MSKVHYFQRYSQKENVVTNNTLLLFSRLYNESPIKFSQFLNALTDGLEINVGINFNQQEKGNGSTPDGAITQESFKISIETKLDDGFFKGQLLRHLKCFNNESTQILVALSPERINQSFLDEIVKAIGDFNAANESNIHFVSTTFENIISHFKDVINDYDIELTSLIVDFEDFCNNEGLMPYRYLRMLTVPCGWTLEDNFEFGVYYDPATRGNSYCTHMGIYKNKRVQGIGKIDNIIVADLVNDNLEILETTNGVATEQQISNIIGIIEAAKTKLGWNISKDHKFYCVERMDGRKYFNQYAGITKKANESRVIKRS
jgi:hypothetical protein